MHICTVPPAAAAPPGVRHARGPLPTLAGLVISNGPARNETVLWHVASSASGLDLDKILLEATYMLAFNLRIC